ncbi:flagellar protein FlaG [Paenalkalicoccus suaedae]|uniref:Flagellar protein FlaG n=1 Tax=Paenalkalicoccus suaedae TaxID=2592382 RepID=A0A859FIY1_9BACI|nr:flagellar protein FlaG [Paenalkalicoccus suaedae]QKS72306.1 flagellar protein FlaG [Paenalkalicoccus suaedae]
MEVNAVGSPSIHEISTKQPQQAERSVSQNRQSNESHGSIDTSSRKAEFDSRELSKEWSQDDLDRGLEAMNDLALFKDRALQFEQHERLNRTMVKVIDKQTEEVIKEIPPEKFLDMISSMLEFAGILIDERR